MKYSDNITIQKFIEQLVDVLKYENEYREPNSEKLNIPFLIAALWQDLVDNYTLYDDFCSDLRDCDSYDIVIEDSNYCIRKVNVFFYNESENNSLKCVEEANFRYEITFSYDERNCGYCGCSPDDPDYREDKHCCGHGCDASFCQFDLYKVLHITNDTWQGDEHDYWDFEDEFYMNDKELADKKAEEDRLRKIEELKNQIEVASKKLKELMGDKV